MIAEPLRGLARPVGELRLLEGNPRRGDVAAVARSLKRFGQRKPVVARADGTVTAGNHTLLAAIELGWPEIAVVFEDDDEATAKAYALADNRTSALGSFDVGDLAAMACEVQAADPELLLAASFTDADLAELLGVKPAGKNDPDDVPEPPAEPITALGDVWLLGPHRIVCGDCRDFGTVERLLSGRRVNLAFTSPPYASQRAYDESSGFRPVPPDEYVDWFEDVQANVRAHLADDGSWFVNIKEGVDDGQRRLYVKDLTIAHVRRWGWRLVDELAWVRPGPPGRWPNRFKNSWEPVFHFSGDSSIKFKPEAVAHPSDQVPKRASKVGGVQSHQTNGDYWNVSSHTEKGMAFPGNVLEIAGVEKRTGHTAPFPVRLPGWFIRAYSDAGDVVFDPFMGSGSTLIAAHRENRAACGCEISPAYTDVILKRYQEHTGTKPVLEATGEPHDFT